MKGGSILEKTRIGELLVIRLADGEEIVKTVSSTLTEDHITSGIILGGVGMLQGAEISFYVGDGNYETKKLEEEVELCSLNGNISTYENDLVVHMHAVVGKRDGSTVSGHLSGGKVHLTAEIAILVLPHAMERRLDEKTGLKLLSFKS